ncbi:EamA family transporter [Rubrivivax gelatinosus]|uniref:EamA-like transporter family protein n=1 Tax=Rubrivivax gelatinosus TaxID=28068 RepID=A0A4R2LUH0_RUBGE|nr:EamA family transporter [Rubrivivax gelatinosus]MBK1690223.1 EamA family transporter [Rubrivivax gelatinosus]TCO97731.1 EamA-like transporter family protein [Rubrivivax gelatinosus]
MSGAVLALVLFAAALHAGWNAVVKGAPDKLLNSVAVAAAAAFIAVLLLPWVARPAPAAWPYIAASGLLHVAYFVLVARAYAAADMALAYPVMRGSAPLLVALASAAVLLEPLGATAWVGVALLCAGILGFAVGARGHGAAGLGYALLNALVIAAYTLVDGLGARLSGQPLAYTLCVLLAGGVPLAAWALARRGPAALVLLRARWRQLLLAGAGTVTSYTLVLWAMTQAPVALVAALRECSIVFAMLLSTLVLGERLAAPRLAAAALVLVGVVILRMA